MPQNYLAKTFISLQATMSPNVMQELSKELRMLQKIDLQQLSKFLKQSQYFQKHSAEITRMQKTYSQLRDIAKPLIEKYPQLEEIEKRHHGVCELLKEVVKAKTPFSIASPRGNSRVSAALTKDLRDYHSVRTQIYCGCHDYTTQVSLQEASKYIFVPVKDSASLMEA